MQPHNKKQKDVLQCPHEDEFQIQNLCLRTFTNIFILEQRVLKHLE
jgi:hypothetical protein